MSGNVVYYNAEGSCATVTTVDQPRRYVILYRVFNFMKLMASTIWSLIEEVTITSSDGH